MTNNSTHELLIAWMLLEFHICSGVCGDHFVKSGKSEYLVGSSAVERTLKLNTRRNTAFESTNFFGNKVQSKVADYPMKLDYKFIVTLLERCIEVFKMASQVMSTVVCIIKSNYIIVDELIPTECH